MKKFTFAQRLYLNLLCAENYPEQAPEYIKAKWYHTLWLLVPIIGSDPLYGISLGKSFSRE